MKISVYGYNAALPLLRPDSYAINFGGDTWAVYTPSTGVSAVLAFGSEEQVITEFSTVGVVNKKFSTDDPSKVVRYTIGAPIVDEDWWLNSAEQGFLGDLDISNWVNG